MPNFSKAYFIPDQGVGGGVPLSMDGATAFENRTTLVDPDPDLAVLVPVPAGLNTQYALRIEVFEVDATSSYGAWLYETSLARDSAGSVFFSGPLENGAGTLLGLINVAAVPGGVEFTLPAPAPLGASRHFAWRWVLSPGYLVPFAIIV